MPRIPIIEQATNVSTGVPTTQAQGMQVVSPFGNAAAVAGSGLDAMVQAKLHTENALWHKENADAVANLSKPMSDAQVFWQQQLTDGQKATVDGGLVKQPDGTTIGFRSKIETDFDTWAKPFVEGVQNPKARQIALEQVNHLRTRVIGQAMAFEAEAGIANRSAKVDESVQTLASQAAKAKTLADVDQLVLTAKTFIANSGFDERTRNDKAANAVRQIVIAANTGAMERDPAGFKAAAIARYGIDPTAPLPETKQGPAAAPAGIAALPNLPQASADSINQTATRLGVSPADLAAIISYETGGKFSPSIRGGKNNKHIGLIQFGEEEQRAYGANQNQTFEEQMGAVERYLKARGVKPGDDLKTLYKIVNAGNRNAPDTAFDGNGTIAQHVKKMSEMRFPPTAPPGPGSELRYPPNGPPGLPAGLTAAAAPAAQPATPVNAEMAALVNKLPIETIPGFISSANTLVNQQQALFRSQITVTEGDHVTAFMNGKAVPRPLTEGEYIRAFGQIDGPQRFANYLQVQQLGSDMSSMKAMPPGQMVALTERYRPDPSKPGYELATKRYDTMVQAANRIMEARRADPIAYAQQAGIGGARPIDWAKPSESMAELARREGIAETMSATYQSPYALLSKDEASRLSGAFAGMSDVEKLAYLGTIATTVRNPMAQRAIFQQIAPDSPVTAVAGKLVTINQNAIVNPGLMSSNVEFSPQKVAALIMRGESMLNPTKAAKAGDGKPVNLIMPPEQDMRAPFNDMVGRAFANQGQAADVAYQAVKAYYAARLAQSGDFSGNYNASLFKEAVQAVTGGKTDFRDSSVLRPWGMPEDKFIDQLKLSFDQKMQYLGRKDRFSAVGLENFQDGYLVKQGTGYMLDNDGNRVVLYVNAPGDAGAGRGFMIPPTVGEMNADPSRRPVTPLQRPVTQQPQTR